MKDEIGEWPTSKRLRKNEIWETYFRIHTNQDRMGSYPKLKLISEEEILFWSFNLPVSNSSKEVRTLPRAY